MLNQFLDQTPQQYDGLCLNSGRVIFEQDLRELVVALQKREEQIVKAVVESDTVLTGKPTRDVNVKHKHFKKTQRKPCPPPPPSRRNK